MKNQILLYSILLIGVLLGGQILYPSGMGEVPNQVMNLVKTYPGKAAIAMGALAAGMYYSLRRNDVATLPELNNHTRTTGFRFTSEDIPGSASHMLLECPICGDEKESIIVEPCPGSTVVHAICRDCLVGKMNSWIEGAKKGINRLSLYTCPICRQNYQSKNFDITKAVNSKILDNMESTAYRNVLISRGLVIAWLAAWLLAWRSCA